MTTVEHHNHNNNSPTVVAGFMGVWSMYGKWETVLKDLYTCNQLYYKPKSLTMLRMLDLRK